MTNKKRAKRPNVGDGVAVRGVRCLVTKVYAVGTMDVVSVCGSYAWRVTGLGWP